MVKVVGARLSRNFAICNIAIAAPTSEREPTIFVEDYSASTPKDAHIPEWVLHKLDKEHLRIFTSMRDFTTWLWDVGVRVDRCWCKRW